MQTPTSTRIVGVYPNTLAKSDAFPAMYSATELIKSRGSMDPVTPEGALAKLAEWRDAHAWVECIVSSRTTSFGYRVVGLVADFDDGFVIGLSRDRCSATLPSVLFHRSDLIDIDAGGDLRLRCPNGDVVISEIEIKDAGHA